jgi:hypothetical protein
MLGVWTLILARAQTGQAIRDTSSLWVGEVEVAVGFDG